MKSKNKHVTINIRHYPNRCMGERYHIESASNACRFVFEGLVPGQKLPVSALVGDWVNENQVSQMLGWPDTTVNIKADSTN